MLPNIITWIGIWQMDDTALSIAIDLIAEFEGFRSKPYLDSGGTPTIGFGFTVMADGSYVTMSTPSITEEDAKSRLQLIVAVTLKNVRSMVYVNITDNQAAALCSLGYNIGTNALRRSTLLKLLNAGDYESAAKSFGAWIYDGSHVSEGLRTRRAKERALFLKDGITSQDPPDDTTDALNDAELKDLLDTLGD